MPLEHIEVLHQSEQTITPVRMAILIVIVELINAYLGFGICLLTAGWCVLRDGRSIRIFSMPGRNIIYVFFAWGIVLGLFQILSGKTQWWPLIRDVVNLARIPLYWYLISFFSEENGHDDNALYKTVFSSSIILSTITLITKIAFLINNDFSFVSFREAGNFSEFSLPLGCYLIAFPPSCFKKDFFSGTYFRIGRIIVIVAAMMSFSRTFLLILICLCLLQINRHWQKLFAVICVGFAFFTVISILFPNAAMQYFEKLRNSLVEISPSRIHWTSSEIVRNWRGYEVHCAQEAFHNASIWEKLFGSGFGSGIDAFGYEYLVTSEHNLPFLHNGYYTTLFKFGILGIGLMALYYFHYFTYAIRVETFENRCLLLGLILSECISASVITGMLWGGCDVLPLFVMAWYMSYVKKDDT